MMRHASLLWVVVVDVCGLVATSLALSSSAAVRRRQSFVLRPYDDERTTTLLGEVRVEYRVDDTLRVTATRESDDDDDTTSPSLHLQVPIPAQEGGSGQLAVAGRCGRHGVVASIRTHFAATTTTGR